jgi:hypothetical protein
MKVSVGILVAVLPLALCWRPPSAIDWQSARTILDEPSNQIVALTSDQVNSDLATLREHWENAANFDCRRRISASAPLPDCSAFVAAVCPEQNNPGTQEEVAAALGRVVDGFSALSGGKQNEDVIIRVVCDDQYTARCPKFHVDKIPARAMVTLLGRGTEFVAPPGSSSAGTVPTTCELELVCFRGGTKWVESKPSNLLSTLFGRDSGLAACEHRSPDGPPERRVFLTLDLPTSKDEPEWLLHR